MTDGTAIMGVTETRFYWTPLVNGVCGAFRGEVGVAWPATSKVVQASQIGEGDFCVFAYYVHPNCPTNTKDCEAANHVEMRITNGVVSDPDLRVVDGDAWYPWESKNSFLPVRIGTFPIGTPCLADWPVGEFYIVNSEFFTPTLPEQATPGVLVAHCE